MAYQLYAVALCIPLIHMPLDTVKYNILTFLLIGLNYSLFTICLIINAPEPSANQPRSLCWAHMLIIVNYNLPLNPPIWALHDWCLPGGQAYCGMAEIRACTARRAALWGRIPLFSPCAEV